MQNRTIELFYIFFQGALIFQVVVFFVLYFISGKKDVLYYTLFLFFAAVYFFVNAPFTFFNIPEEIVWNSVWYDHLNTPLIIAENIFYILFLRTFFSDITIDKTIYRLFRFILWVIPFLIIIFIVLTILQINKQAIFYTVNMMSVIPAAAVTLVLLKKRPPFAKLVANGLLCTIFGTSITVFMIALGNNGVQKLFTTGYPLFFIKLGVLGDMIFYQTAILKKWHYHEKNFMIEMLNERLRISRELHDDMGSTLGSISIYSEVAKNRAEKNENSAEALSKIGIASRELIDKMSDIVWSLNPNNESFDQLQNRMQAFAAMILTPRGIHYHLDVEEETNKLKLTTEERKNIYLIYKEAIHNIVKYSECSQVAIRLNKEDGTFAMTVRDDGKGFSLNDTPAYNGNGIKSMLARAADINASLDIHSTSGEGTMIALKLKI